MHTCVYCGKLTTRCTMGDRCRFSGWVHADSRKHRCVIPTSYVKHYAFTIIRPIKIDHDTYVKLKRIRVQRTIEVLGGYSGNRPWNSGNVGVWRVRKAKSLQP